MVKKNRYQPPGKRRKQAKPPVDLPVTFQVGTSRWWTGAIISSIATVILTCALLGVPEWMFDPNSPRTGIWQTLSIIGAPIALFCTFYYGRAALRPDNATLSETGISTPSWELTWDEVQEVSVKGEKTAPDGQVQLWVTQDVFSRVGPKNRWCSGRPLRMGGLVSKIPVIQLQQGMKTRPDVIAETVERTRKYVKRRSS